MTALPLSIMLLFAFVAHALKFRALFSTRTALCRTPLHCRHGATHAVYDDLLSDMIYSGDLRGFMKRSAKSVVSEDFLDFVNEKIGRTTDEDELPVLQEISAMIDTTLDQNDGLVDAGEVFEKRLNDILYLPPSRRREHVQNKKVDLTSGFIRYVQAELKATSDMDSKVVLASVLKLISDTVGAEQPEKVADILGTEAAELVGMIAQPPAPASGLLLHGNFEEAERDIAAGKNIKVGDRNEQILAGLMFSQNDVVEDVLSNLHEINREFVRFLEDKLDASRDFEERAGLASLKETIEAVLKKVEEIEGSKVETSAELTFEEVKQLMRAVQQGKNAELEKTTGRSKFADFTVQADPRSSFLAVLQRFRDLPRNMTLAEAVAENYHLCDYAFMQELHAEITNSLNSDNTEKVALVEDRQSAEAAVAHLRELQEAVTAVMAEKVGSAQARLEKVLRRGRPALMEAEIGMMVRRGEVDEALVLLIEANIQQAKATGGQGGAAAAEIMKKLIKRIALERDRIQPDEQRYLRELLMMDTPDKRKGLLHDIFRPQKAQNAEGDWVDGAPVIPPPVFINMLRGLIQELGNVESFQIMKKAEVLIEEAQLVATELYGEGMTPQQAQRFMFEKKTVSVWDLANFEEQALMSGEEVPWRNDKFDKMAPEEVLGERVRKIGGG